MLLHRQIRSALISAAQGFDLTAQQAEVLCVLNNHEPSFGELAQMLGCDKTNITGLADRLARRRLVDRYTDPVDRRVSRLGLTEEGQTLQQRIKEVMAATVEERWGALPASDRRTLVRLVSDGLGAPTQEGAEGTG